MYLVTCYISQAMCYVTQSLPLQCHVLMCCHSILSQKNVHTSLSSRSLPTVDHKKWALVKRHSLPFSRFFLQFLVSTHYVMSRVRGTYCSTCTWSHFVEASWNVMAHARKPEFVFRRNRRVHLNRRWRQFSRLLKAEVCASAAVMLDTPCSEVVWRVLATHSIRQFPLRFPLSASPCAITFQLESNKGFYPKQGGIRTRGNVCNHHDTSRCHSHEDHNPNYNKTIEHSIRCAPTIFKQGIRGIVILYSAWR